MPTSLTATKIKDTYGQVLHVDGGVTSTPKSVYDGDGTATALKVSTTDVQVNNSPVLTDADIGSTVQAYDADLTAWSGKTAPSGTVVGTSDSQALSNKSFSDNPVYSAGTANGVAYLNGSKVLTTGSALTFDGNNLSAGTSGSQNLGTASIKWGTVYAGSMADGTDQLIGSVSTTLRVGFGASWTAQTFGIGSSEQMRLTSTGLGIGTSSPSTKLHVVGAGAQALFEGSIQGSVVIQKTGTSGIQLFSDSAGKLGFYDANSTLVRMTLDSSGNLGLGVTPSAWNSGYKAMQFGSSGVMWSTGIAGARWGVNYYLNGAGTLTYINTTVATDYRQSSGEHQWFTAPSGTAGNAISFTQAMTLDASGNLGVGTTTPDIFSRFYSRVVGISNATGNTALCLNAPTSSACYVDLGVNSSRVFGIYADPNYYTSLSTISAIPLTFGTNNAERMRIDSSGNVLIGTTTAGASKLVVNSDSIQVNTAKTPASASATGTTGQIAWDANYIYVCVATNTWKRSAIATW